MAKLGDIMDPDQLALDVANGYVSKRESGTGLILFDYSNKAQFERYWTTETTQCRGLIVDEYDNIVARPFPKFHNIEEHSRSDIVFSKPFRATEKMDGSLGILYPDPVGIWKVATRGSFESDQAKWATKWLYENHPSWLSYLPLDLTYTLLFEIIYRENRIVVDYGNFEGLVYLAGVNIETGQDAPAGYTFKWPGRVVQSYPVEELHPRDVGEKLGVDDGNHEGFVLAFDWPQGKTTRVKVKLDEYKRLHRIVTGVSTKTIWEHLANGWPLDDLLERVPDEFYTWVVETIGTLRSQFDGMCSDARREFVRIEREMQGDETGRFAYDSERDRRKAFAGLIQGHVYAPLMFKLYDGREIDELVWKWIEPKYGSPFKREVAA